MGRREHYRLARELIARQPRRAVLMQRSSTILLGPEDGWDHEAEFHDEICRSLAAGTQWYHVVSLDGIEHHLKRPGSTFALAGTRPNHIVEIGEEVAIRSAGPDPPASIRSLPDEYSSGFDGDFKLDRQARLLAVELDHQFEALVVSDIGDQQLTIKLRGDPARTVFDAAVALYERCPPLNPGALRIHLDRFVPAEGAT